MNVYVDGKDISPSVRDFTVNTKPFDDFTEAMQEFSRVCALAGTQITLFGHAYFSLPIYGQRRHGLIKHLRDLKRAEMKREARR